MTGAPVLELPYMFMSRQKNEGHYRKIKVVDRAYTYSLTYLFHVSG